jgi:hypothetical protein
VSVLSTQLFRYFDIEMRLKTAYFNAVSGSVMCGIIIN